MPERRLTELESTCWFSVVEAYNECNRRYASMLQEFDLTVPQFDVLSAIHTLGERAIPKAIAEKLLVTRGNITGLLTRLQQRKLIRTRQLETDGRSFVCELTPKGARLLSEAKAGAAFFIQEQLAPFNEGDMRAIRRTMTEMQEHLKTMDPISIAFKAQNKGHSA